jgi:TonB-dependent starch-binding outer membrane protein SusC
MFVGGAMALRVCGTSVLFTLLGAQLLSAQVRQINGRVTNASTGEGLSEATIAVNGTSIVAQSGNDGRYVLNAPDGDQTLVVRAIGYKRREIQVPAAQGTAEVALEPDVFKLEEIVITGQATGVERQNLPNAVATVDAADISRAPTPTLESALQGKIPGALIQANSGAPGGGIQLNLRGVSTINASVDPLFVVDGIVISNAAIPNGANAVTAAQAGGNPRNQDNPVNRLADLNPEDIERVEVLKGGSAAAIYGSKATNGVVIITTKRGQQGKPQFNISQRFGFFEAAHLLGQRDFPTLADALQFSTDTALVASIFQQGRSFNFEDELYGRKPLSTETSASVSGGSVGTQYFISGLVKNDGGIATNTGYKKQAVRANIDQDLGSGIQLAVNTNVIHSSSDRGLSNNDNAGTSPYLVFPFTPSFMNLQPVNGVFPVNPFERSNPLQTFALLQNDEDVWRVLGTATARWSLVRSARSNLQLVTIAGVDFFNQRNNFVSPPELQFEPNDGQPGTVVLTKAQNRNLNLAVNATHTYTPGSESWQATTSAGIQYEDRELNSTQILGRTLLAGSSPDLAASVTPFQEIEPVRDLGLFGQEEVLLMDRKLLLTAGVRADRSSSNGDTGEYFLYPKAAASYRLVKPFGGVDELKLRAAYGQTGNRPVFGTKYVSDTTATIGGNFGTLVSIQSGDPNIKPERQKEYETGIDATFADSRADLSLTLYQRNISDLILVQTIAPSIGQQFRAFSSTSTLRNQGVEASLGLQLVRNRDVNWLFRTTYSMNRSKITHLSVPTFQTGGFGTSLGTFQIEEGKSATQIAGREGVVGDAYPDFQMSFTNDIDFKAFTLGFLFDWKQGGDIINLTEFLYDAGQNSKDYVTAGATRQQHFADSTGVYVQDGSYLKLREVTLGYTLPTRLTSSLFGANIRYARLSLSGRNLLRFTDYRGLDPEVSNFGNQAIVRNVDVAPFPPSRSFFLSVDLGF